MHHGQFPNIALTEKNNETFKKGWAYLDGEEETGVIVLLNFFSFQNSVKISSRSRVETF